WARVHRYRPGRSRQASLRSGREGRGGAGSPKRELTASGITGRASAAGHEAIGDATLGKVVGRELDEHFVAGQHADAVLAHLAGRVAEDLMTVLELDA